MNSGQNHKLLPDNLIFDDGDFQSFQSFQVHDIGHLGITRQGEESLIQNNC